jgi:hypothetical protein
MARDHVRITADWMTDAGASVRLAIRDAREFHGVTMAFDGYAHLVPRRALTAFQEVLQGDSRPSVQWLRRRITSSIPPAPSSAAALTQPALRDDPANLHGAGQVDPVATAIPSIDLSTRTLRAPSDRAGTLAQPEQRTLFDLIDAVTAEQATGINNLPQAGQPFSRPISADSEKPGRIATTLAGSPGAAAPTAILT